MGLLEELDLVQVRHDVENGTSVCSETWTKVLSTAERYKDAYENMRKFAEQNGLDTTTYGLVEGSNDV